MCGAHPARSATLATVPRRCRIESSEMRRAVSMITARDADTPAHMIEVIRPPDDEMGSAGLIHTRSVLPEFNFDYCFPGKTEGKDNLKVLVGRERGKRMTMATVVSRKGADKFVVKRVAAFLKETGCEYRDIIVKADQEPAIQALMTELGKH